MTVMMGAAGAREEVTKKLELLKVVGVEEDPSSSGTKVKVTVELPIEGFGRGYDLEEFFRLDDIKRMVIREASRITNRSTGWSDISRLHYMKDGESAEHFESADAVRVIYTCLSVL